MASLPGAGEALRPSAAGCSGYATRSLYFGQFVTMLHRHRARGLGQREAVLGALGWRVRSSCARPRMNGRCTRERKCEGAILPATACKQKSHHAAVRALAYKWLRILYRCWNEPIPYHEAP